MKIKTKLAVNTLLVFLLLLISSIVVFILQNRIMIETETMLYNNSYKSISLVLNADRDYYQALEALNKFNVTKEAKYKNDYDENMKQVNERVTSAIETLSKEPDHWSSIFTEDSKDTIFTVYESFKSSLQDWNSTVSSGTLNEEKFDKTRGNLNKLGELIDKGAETSIKDIKDMEKIARNTEMIMYLLIILIVAISGYVIARYINKSILKINHVISKCELGEINERIGIKNKDEIGAISNKFDSFISKIESIIKDIQLLSTEVSKSNEVLLASTNTIVNGSSQEKGIIQLNDFINNILDNVRNQTASTEESLAALEEISATSTLVNQNIQSSKESFSETIDITKSSSYNIEKMTGSMEEINERVNKAKHDVESLKNISNNIGTIITSINAIAAQTNLLALNAAIEAARAGEAGKGFSVVAEEIRKLAEQTNKETNKIEELVKTVQSSVQSVELGNKNVLEKVVEGISLSSNSKKDMINISKLTNKNKDDIDSISVSMNEQVQASSEITLAISGISDSSTEIESLSIETTEVSEHIKNSLIKNQKMVNGLNELVDKLKSDLEFFKI